MVRKVDVTQGQFQSPCLEPIGPVLERVWQVFPGDGCREADGRLPAHGMTSFDLDRISGGQASTAHAVLLPTAYFTAGTEARFHNTGQSVILYCMASPDEPQVNHNESLFESLRYVSMGFFISAFLVALSRALIRFQPWAGICLSSLFALLSGWGFNWFLPKLRQRKGYDSAKRRESDAASIGFLAVAAACCSAIFLSGPSILWLALALFLISMGLLYIAAKVGFGGMRALWEAIIEGAQVEVEDEANVSDSSNDSYSYLGDVAAPIIASGLYFLVFFPLTLWIASSRGTPLIDVLLLIDVSNASTGLGLLDRIRLVASDPVFYFPMGIFYSAAAIARVFLLSLRAKPLLETSSMVFGLMTGYAFAVFAARWSGNQIRPTVFTPSLGIAYVLLLHYSIASIAECLPNWGMRVKYDHLLGGLESIGTAFILSRVYGLSAAIFGGAVFSVSSFLGASLWEITIGRLMKQIAPLFDEPPLIKAWEELRSLLRGDHHRDERRAVQKQILISSLVMIVMPLLACFVFSLFGSA